MTLVGDPFDTLLSALEEADDQLRAIYRELADDPGLAPAREDALRALQTKRGALATEVGLAALVARRAANGLPASAPTEAPTAGAPPAPPVSAEAIEQWSQKARANGVGTVAYEDRITPTWEMTLARLMTRVGPPRDLDIDLGDELDALDAVGTEPFLGLWATLPAHVQIEWVGMLAARTRALRELSGLPFAQRGRIKTIISRYPAWASEHRPGHMHGLKADHEPQHGSWLEDARHLWRTLDSEMSDLPPRSSPSLPKKKKHHESDDAPDTTRAIDAAWPLWPRVRGRNVLMVGGEPREPNRQRIERTFELASLDWMDISGPRKVGAAVERVRRRKVDIVVLLKGLVDHTQSEPIVAAAKESGVPWAMAESYGPTSIKAGLDRFLGT